MKQFLTKMVTGMLVVFTIALVSSSVQATEKKSISGTKVTKRIISRNTVHPGDDPRHLMTQTVREDAVTSSDTDWNDMEAISYEQAEHTDGNGSHGGYLIIHHKNGDETFVKYQGTDKMTAGGGAWEVSSEGEIQFIGGTGAFKNVKGNGKYKGKSSAKGSIVNWEATLEY